MVICCLGDSLTEGDYGIFGKTGMGNVQEKNYPYFLAKSTGATVKNYGKCGYRTIHYLDYYNEGNIDVTDADIIVLMIGTNGGHSKEGNSDNDKAYITLVEKLRAAAPKAKLAVCTPPHVTENEFYSNCGYAGQVADAVYAVREAAKKLSLPLIDVAAFPVFCAESEELFQSNDGLHFNELGYRVLAAFIEANLKKLFPNIFNYERK